MPDLSALSSALERVSANLQPAALREMDARIAAAVKPAADSVGAGDRGFGNFPGRYVTTTALADPGVGFRGGWWTVAEQGRNLGKTGRGRGWNGRTRGRGLRSKAVQAMRAKVPAAVQAEVVKVGESLRG